jgi:hypothetical protein
MTSPTQRSLARLRKEGYIVAVVEKWLPLFGKKKPGEPKKKGFGGIRVDLFGFADILGFRVSPPDFLLVQTTTNSGSNFTSRIRKCEENGVASAWKLAGGRIQIHGWSKRGARGKRKLWEVKIHEL